MNIFFKDFVSFDFTSMSDIKFLSSQLVMWLFGFNSSIVRLYPYNSNDEFFIVYKNGKLVDCTDNIILYQTDENPLFFNIIDCLDTIYIRGSICNNIPIVCFVGIENSVLYQDDIKYRCVEVDEQKEFLQKTYISGYEKEYLCVDFKKPDQVLNDMEELLYNIYNSIQNKQGEIYSNGIILFVESDAVNREFLKKTALNEFGIIINIQYTTNEK